MKYRIIKYHAGKGVSEYLMYSGRDSGFEFVSVNVELRRQNQIIECQVPKSNSEKKKILNSRLDDKVDRSIRC